MFQAIKKNGFKGLFSHFRLMPDVANYAKEIRLAQWTLLWCQQSLSCESSNCFLRDRTQKTQRLHQNSYNTDAIVPSLSNMPMCLLNHKQLNKAIKQYSFSVSPYPQTTAPGRSFHDTKDTASLKRRSGMHAYSSG